MNEKTPIFGDPQQRERGVGKVSTSVSAPSPSAGAVYHDSIQSPRARYLMMGTIAVISAMVLIALILCIYRGASTGKQGFLYFLVGASLIGFIVVEGFIFRFLMTEDLNKDKAWFLYFMGFCTLVEATLVAVIVMN